MLEKPRIQTSLPPYTSVSELRRQNTDAGACVALLRMPEDLGEERGSGSPPRTHVTVTKELLGFKILPSKAGSKAFFHVPSKPPELIWGPSPRPGLQC